MTPDNDTQGSGKDEANLFIHPILPEEMRSSQGEVNDTTNDE